MIIHGKNEPGSNGIQVSFVTPTFEAEDYQEIYQIEDRRGLVPFRNIDDEPYKR